MSDGKVIPLFNDRRPLPHPVTKDDHKDHMARMHGRGVVSKSDLTTRRLTHNDDHRDSNRQLPGYVSHTHGN